MGTEATSDLVKSRLIGSAEGGEAGGFGRAVKEVSAPPGPERVVVVVGGEGGGGLRPRLCTKT